MTEQTALPGLSPEEQRTRNDMARLIKLVREIATIDLHALSREVKRESWQEAMVMGALDFKRAMREQGVVPAIAMLAHAQRQEANE